MRTRRNSFGSRRGGALVIAVLVMAMVAMLAATMVMIQASGATEQTGARAESRAALVAEAGLSQSFARLQAFGERRDVDLLRTAANLLR